MSAGEKAKAKTEQAEGKAKQILGRALGNDRMAAEGQAEKSKRIEAGRGPLNAGLYAGPGRRTRRPLLTPHHQALHRREPHLSAHEDVKGKTPVLARHDQCGECARMTGWPRMNMAPLISSPWNRSSRLAW